MSKVKKKKVSNKFDTDVVSNSVVGKYGDVVSTGTEVLATINRPRSCWHLSRT